MKQLCPVCQGHGVVPTGFYMYPPQQETYSTTNASPETCRACQGIGVIDFILKTKLESGSTKE